MMVALKAKKMKSKAMKQAKRRKTMQKNKAL